MTRLAVISDVHGNLPALEAIVAAVGADVDGWICAGDIAGGVPMVDEVVMLLRSLGAHCVLGNHDQALVEGLAIPSSSAGTRALQIQRRHTTPETRSWLAALPTELDLKVDGTAILVRHGGPADTVHQKIRSITDDVRMFAAGRIAIFGHTHRPIHEFGADHSIVNPGSVGLPIDGDRRAQVSILDVAARTVEEIRIDYDASAAIARMRDLGYDERYGNCLTAGRWVGFKAAPPPLPVIVAGAAIYGEMIAELIHERPDLTLVGFVDDRVSGSFAGAPVLGRLDGLMEIADAHACVDVAVAIGDNALRRIITERIRSAGVRAAQLVHRTAVVSKSARLGLGCIVDAGAYVGPHCVLQDGVSVWPGVLLSHDTHVGAFASLKPGAVVGGGSRISPEAKVELGAVWPSYSQIPEG